MKKLPMTVLQRLRSEAILLVANRRNPRVQETVETTGVGVETDLVYGGGWNLLRAAAARIVTNRSNPAPATANVQVSAPNVDVRPATLVSAPNVNHQSHVAVAAPNVRVEAPNVQVHGTPVKIDMTTVAEAMRELSDMLGAALQALAERPPIQFSPRFAPVVQVPKQPPTPTPPSPRKREFVIRHDDGTESTITEKL